MKEVTNKVALNNEEQSWVAMMSNGDQKGLENIFNRYYKYLVVTAYNYLNDDERSKDLVQDVFLKLWEQRQGLKINNSLKAFLRKAVVNKSIDEIRKKRIDWKEDFSDLRLVTEEASSQAKLEANDLQEIINKAIEALPDKCRLVFSLSRFENLSHKEISSMLNISTKTIENQMTKALKSIRAAVDQGHLPTFIFLILYFIHFI